MLRFFALLIAGAACLPAQQILRRLSSYDFTYNFTPLGDVNGDGYEDALVTSVVNPGGLTFFDNELRVYSGRDGSLIRRGPYWPIPDVGFAFPHGDHDHDGVRDYLCWDRDSTLFIQRLTVRSGRDDHILWMVQQPVGLYWAQHVIGNLDLDGDGGLDVVVSHPVGPAGYGVIRAYNHQGNLLYQLFGPHPPYTLAQSLAKLGDVNGDGCDDYLCGLGDPSWAGAVAVISGPTGQFLRIVTGQAPPDYIGGGCVGCGDIDADGIPDFAAGGGLSGSTGSVQAFSGATGNRLFTHYSGYLSDHYGSVLQSGDYDHDGVNDILAPSWFGFRVVSGREGTQIAFHQPSPGNWATFRVLALATPDGFPNLLLQTQLQGTLLMTSRPHQAEVLGPGCAFAGPGAAGPRLGMRELTVQDRRLTLHDAEPGSLAFLLLGLASASPAPVSLSPLGLPHCSLYPSLQVLGGFTTGTAGVGAGYAQHDFVLPNPAAFGLGIVAQWLTLDANFTPVGLTAGIRFAIY